MNTNVRIILGVFLLLILGTAFLALQSAKPTSPVPPAATPTPVASTVPSATPTTENLLILDSPEEDATITSPLKISGRARGQWFFEGTFPIEILDYEGNKIGEGYATAQGEWMTEEFVPFTAELKFKKPAEGETGTLILKKANPSGLPENDRAQEYSVFFE